MPAATPFSSSLTRLSPRGARCLLLCVLIATGGAIGITVSPLKSGYAEGPDRGPGDLALYNAEIRRISAGQSYYQAASVELRARGYPTRSIFNWRTPLPMVLLGQLPHPLCGRVLLGLLALVALYAAFALLEREGSVWQGVGCGALLMGAWLPCVLPEVYVAPELWAAVFITLSLCAYERQWPLVAVCLGVAALFFRDLAGLYCLTMGLMALSGRQWRELFAWFCGLIVYMTFFAWHVSNVLPLIGGDDLAHRGSWLQLGGLPFVLSTSQMNVLLLLSPQPLTAVALAMALVGLAGWNSKIGQRIGITLCAYLALFAAVGHPFNQYWGSLFAPLICFGVARFPATMAELWCKARQPAIYRGRLKTWPPRVQ